MSAFVLMCDSLTRRAPHSRRTSRAVRAAAAAPLPPEVEPQPTSSKLQGMRAMLLAGQPLTAGQLARANGTTAAMVDAMLSIAVRNGEIERYLQRGSPVFRIRPEVLARREQDAMRLLELRGFEVRRRGEQG